MVQKLSIIILLFGNSLYAQFKPAPTQFDKFVKKSNIEWAAYASDTFNFDNANLNNILLSRMYKNEIKGSLPVESRTPAANFIKYLKMDSINYIFHFGNNQPGNMYDSLGNIIEEEKVLPKIDTSTFNVTEITQILYVEKGKLKSYITFVTPTLPVFISSGAYLGETFYFTSCYNYKYCKKSRKKSKLVFLSQTKKMIPLNPAQPNEKLKEMYGKNLIETLWPQILAGKIDVFTVDNKKIKPEDLYKSFASSDPVLVPIYDSTAKTTIYKYEVAAGTVEPKLFTSIELIQDWYYDAKRNKISNIVAEAWLYTKKWTTKGEDKEASPILKLVFK